MYNHVHVKTLGYYVYLLIVRFQRYSNCSCIEFESEKEHSGGVEGTCSQNCDHLLYAFLPLMAVVVFFWFITASPGLAVIIRFEF